MEILQELTVEDIKEVFGDLLSQYLKQNHYVVNSNRECSDTIDLCNLSSDTSSVTPVDTSDVSKDNQPCPDVPTVTDRDNNTYKTVQIGSQCWMAENLRVKTSPKGNLQAGPQTGTNTNLTNAYYFDYTTSTIPDTVRGLLYNWAAVIDTTFTANEGTHVSFENRQGICPDGWHIPSQAEWEVLLAHVSGSADYVCGTDNANIAKALAIDKYWYNQTGECAPGNQQESNNKTGFGAVPGG